MAGFYVAGVINVARSAKWRPTDYSKEEGESLHDDLRLINEHIVKNLAEFYEATQIDGMKVCGPDVVMEQELFTRFITDRNSWRSLGDQGIYTHLRAYADRILNTNEPAFARRLQSKIERLTPDHLYFSLTSALGVENNDYEWSLKARVKGQYRVYRQVFHEHMDMVNVGYMRLGSEFEVSPVRAEYVFRDDDSGLIVRSRGYCCAQRGCFYIFLLGAEVLQVFILSEALSDHASTEVKILQMKGQSIGGARLPTRYGVGVFLDRFKEPVPENEVEDKIQALCQSVGRQDIDSSAILEGLTNHAKPPDGLPVRVSNPNDYYEQITDSLDDFYHRTERMLQNHFDCLYQHHPELAIEETFRRFRHKEVRRVKNTHLTFKISDNDFYLPPDRDRIGTLIYKHVVAGGVWEDVCTQEKKGEIYDKKVQELFEQLKKEGHEQLDGVCIFKMLDNAMPAVNLIILEYGDDDKQREVFFGWGYFGGNEKGQVFSSTHPMIVEYFDKYFRVLFDLAETYFSTTDWQQKPVDLRVTRS